jgi:U3 small nucleolar RNA-associated protein 21
MSSLYSPFRAIGYVCDTVPFSVNRLGEEIFVTVSIGKCFQVFRLNKLVACLVSKSAPGNISSLQAIDHETYVAVNKSIVVYDRASIVRTYDSHSEHIVGMLSVGKTLISFDSGNNIKVGTLR